VNLLARDSTNVVLQCQLLRLRLCLGMGKSCPALASIDVHCFGRRRRTELRSPHISSAEVLGISMTTKWATWMGDLSVYWCFSRVVGQTQSSRRDRACCCFCLPREWAVREGHLSGAVFRVLPTTNCRGLLRRGELGRDYLDCQETKTGHPSLPN